MRIRFFQVALLLLAFTALGLNGAARAQEQEPPTSFWTGADLSQLPFHEAQGDKYSDEAGEANLLVIAKRNGWNLIRVRLWVNPDQNTPEYAVSNLENVMAFGKRIKAAKLGFLLDIHYSDTWADPAQQRKPKAWEALPFEELKAQVRSYSRDVVAHLRENGAMPDLVQIGNETRNGLLFGSGLNGAAAQPGGGFWENVPGGRERAVQLLQAGLLGVREGALPAPIPKCILHLPDGQDPDFTSTYMRDLWKSARSQNIALDFDIIGLSYYPADPWDEKVGFPGWTLARLAQSMNTLSATYNKPVMIVETDWPYRGDHKAVPGTPEFARTPEGQAAFYRALIQTVKAVPNGLGIGVLPWNQDSFAWQSVFDEEGRALPAVRVLEQKP